MNGTGATSSWPRELLQAVLGLALLALLLQAAIHFADSRGWRLPWYFVQEMTLGALPMLWLLRALRSRLQRGEMHALLYTGGFFLALSYVCEYIALAQRYWWFYQAKDWLLGIEIVGIPIEELIYYPFLLGIPVLLYIYWQKHLGPEPATDARRQSRVIWWTVTVLATACIAVGVALFVRGLYLDGPAADLALDPAPDAAGLIRYTTGPAARGWTVIQSISLGVGLLSLRRLWPRLHRAALTRSLVLYLPYAVVVEAMACSRGWWVWNSQQVSGIFTGILPLDSYVMYLTGFLLPILLYEALHPMDNQDPVWRSREPSPVVA